MTIEQRATLGSNRAVPAVGPNRKRYHIGAQAQIATIRSSDSHEAGLPQLPEHEAPEQSAAFGVLARRVDTATQET